MPTVYRENGFAFFFYANEGGEAPHIHVRRGDGVCKWWLDPLTLDRSYGFKAGELQLIARILADDAVRLFLMERWDEFHHPDA